MSQQNDINPSRRDFLAKSAILSSVAFLGGISMPFNAISAAMSQSKLLGFKNVLPSTEDKIIVADGYKAEVLLSWGDKIFANSPSFDPNGKNSAADQMLQFGDNNDGMSLFTIDENNALLAINHEYPNQNYLFAHGGNMPVSREDVDKSKASVGLAVVAISRANMDSRWEVNINSKYNRRITAETPMQISGPAKGHHLLKTSADPKAETVLGTLNNCANGQTPWGTYLTCEENFDDYFGYADPSMAQLDSIHKRYGVKKSSEYGWEKFDDRFDLTKNPNEPNRFGWVVEIDPMDPNSTPIKRTALGRLKHENASITVAKNGHVVVYMGDDERGEYIYKFVSKHKYMKKEMMAKEMSHDDMKKDMMTKDMSHDDMKKDMMAKDMSNNMMHYGQLLDEGTLYVARFDKSDKPLQGKGEWIELTHGKNGLNKTQGFSSQADVLINTRKAADVVMATRMDRPEWIAINPKNGQVFCTLTNNSDRGKEGMPINAANPRVKNSYGQIIRWHEHNDDHSGISFNWDMYVLAGNPTVHAKGDLNSGTANINAENMFNSPDGIGFDNDGRVWIQTDGKYSNKDAYAGQGNNSMLAGDPSTGEIRRFLTGPKSCEITGIAFTPDSKTMFVNIQHPGEANDSTFPNNSARPRSSVIIITKDDHGVIGA